MSRAPTLSVHFVPQIHPNDWCVCSAKKSSSVPADDVTVKCSVCESTSNLNQCQQCTVEFCVQCGKDATSALEVASALLLNTVCYCSEQCALKLLVSPIHSCTHCAFLVVIIIYHCICWLESEGIPELRRERCWRQRRLQPRRSQCRCSDRRR